MPENLDDLDRLILDIIQGDFPLESRPYRTIGERVGIGEQEAFDRVERMRECGLIRRLGANFQSGKIGFVSTLCAAKVPAEKVEEFVEMVNGLPEVTHNYERDHEYNIWFTLISPSRAASTAAIKGLEARSGVRILDLPATRLYKIKVDFPMADKGLRAMEGAAQEGTREAHARF